MSQRLILIRGLPGSGKSTMARSLRFFQHFEADMFHIGADGIYRFDHTRARQAHEWCLGRVKRALSACADVVVSNTFTQRWEMEPYISLAKKYGADVTILTCEGKFKSVHSVPDDIINAMRERWED